MGILVPERFIKAECIDPGSIRRQLDQSTSLAQSDCMNFSHKPTSNTQTPGCFCHADAFDLCAFHACSGKAGYEYDLNTAEDVIVLVHCQ